MSDLCVCFSLGATINVIFGETNDCTTMLNRKLNSEQCEFEQMTIIANNIIISIAIIIMVTIFVIILLLIVILV